MTPQTRLRVLRDRLLLGSLGLLPRPVARHLLFLLQTQPALADEWGFHVRPIHYYDPLPDYRRITGEATRRRRVSSAIDFNLPGQLELMRRLGTAYHAEILDLEDPLEGLPFHNEYFSGLDAAVYYSLIRDLGPARVLEIGSGFSTRIADRALRRNRADGRPGSLTCIEPYPEARLTSATLDMTLIQERVEEVPLGRFDELQANDILFIDSSHAVKFGGDVCREILEILPRLRPGVWVHVHDIFFPHDYPADWLIERRIAWTEQYLLEGFLAFNRAFATRAALQWLWIDHLDSLRSHWPAMLFPALDGLGPASFWMTRIE